MAEKSPEQTKKYQVAKEFSGVNTKANRTAIKDVEFSWLENTMPVGFGNLKTVPAQVNVAITGGGGNVTWANTATGLQAVNINNIDYVIAFEENGAAQAFNLQAGTLSNIAASGKFSTANVVVTQWKDERALIIDPAKGYFNWDGNNVVSIGSLGPIAISNQGAGYTDTPAVVIAPPDDPNGVQATAVASISQNAGTVQSLSVTSQGAGYQFVPNVTVSAPQLPAGATAVATATILGNAVVALNLISPGSGYTAPPTITISGGGSVVNVATGQAVLNTGVIVDISLTNPGTGYSKAPTVALSGGNPTNIATALASLISFVTGTVTCLVQTPGTGYTNPGNLVVTISGGDGTNAAAVASISGNGVSSISMTVPGSNYTVPPLVTISGGGGANATAIAVVSSKAPTDVQTFSGRAWISQGRVVFFTAADSYNDLASVSAGSFEITDNTLHSDIKSMLTANNFLYVTGEDSINVFSDVSVQPDGTTIFTNTNVSASVGSRYRDTVFPYYRTVMLQNDYGMFALVGATTTKLSDALDGIIPLIDFTQPVSAGQVIINNILCACFNFTYRDPVQGSRQLQAVFFEKKWFFTSQGGIQRVVNVPFNGQQQLYGTDGIALYQLYGNASVSVNTKTQSALWDLGDPIRTKQALKFGVEATLGTATALTIQVDSETANGTAMTFSGASTVNSFTWTNQSAAVVPWVNGSNAPFSWSSGGQVALGYFLFKNDAQQYGKYLGFTITSNTGSLTINTLELEHELRARF